MPENQGVFPTPRGPRRKSDPSGGTRRRASTVGELPENRRRTNHS